MILRLFIEVGGSSKCHVSVNLGRHGTAEGLESDLRLMNAGRLADRLEKWANDATKCTG